MDRYSACVLQSGKSARAVPTSGMNSVSPTGRSFPPGTSCSPECGWNRQCHREGRIAALTEGMQRVVQVAVEVSKVVGLGHGGVRCTCSARCRKARGAECERSRASRQSHLSALVPLSASPSPTWQKSSVLPATAGTRRTPWPWAGRCPCGSTRPRRRDKCERVRPSE